MIMNIDKLRKQFEEILKENGMNENVEHNFIDALGVKYGRGIAVNKLLHAVDQQHQETREKIAGMKDACQLNFHGNTTQIPMTVEIREMYGKLTCAKCATLDEALQILP